MDRRLLFPAIAATAWAQQVSPAANSEAEKALRARAQQFYQLEVDKNFRRAEAFVAEDTKDSFYTNSKPDIKKFKLGEIEMSKDGTHAVVHLTATVVMTAPVGSQSFDVPSSANWKLEDGQWVWYVSQAPELDTPFGKWRPGAAGSTGSGMPAGMITPGSSEPLISIDRSSVELKAGSRAVQTVTLFNHLPGPVSLEIGSDLPAGLTVEIDKHTLAPGEKGIVSFSVEGNARPSGQVHIKTAPLPDLVIQITTK